MSDDVPGFRPVITDQSVRIDTLERENKQLCGALRRTLREFNPDDCHTRGNPNRIDPGARLIWNNAKQILEEIEVG